MSSINAISSDKLARLIGVPHCPALIDVRTDGEWESDPRFVPGAARRPHASVTEWAGEIAGRAVIIIDQKGDDLGEGIAAWLRHAGADSAEVLIGGHVAWAQSNGPLVPEANLPPRDALGRAVWVTRARPKVDRIACPWLIRRFVDPAAVFLLVSAAEVQGVAERFSAAPFDIDGAFWSHRGECCTFDTMLDEWGLALEPLQRLSVIVRGADTARPDLAPEAAGLLAASLGLSRMYPDNLDQLDAGLALYDAFYRWCRDATDEPHNWPATKSGKTT
ncbi:chromate resistance protein ChrB domain-containing protein [Methylocystis rosea]|uniref:chromate resistance protein ChrB domain-containing protein n=1 Tax=Methylocystis rosea TaxID=173366 RepID=UPI0003784660|nr:sulfurtransferase/chromate resistance protein [Methylocystis rosea]